MRLPHLEGYLKFPGPFPVASIRLKYVSRPKAAERFVPREDRADPPGRADDTKIAASAPAAEPGGDADIAIPGLPGEAHTEPADPSAAKDAAPDRAPRGDGPEPVPLPGETEDAPAEAVEPAEGEAGETDGEPEEGGVPGKGPGIAI